LPHWSFSGYTGAWRRAGERPLVATGSSEVAVGIVITSMPSGGRAEARQVLANMVEWEMHLWHLGAGNVVYM